MERRRRRGWVGKKKKEGTRTPRTRKRQAKTGLRNSHLSSSGTRAAGAARASDGNSNLKNVLIIAGRGFVFLSFSFFCVCGVRRAGKERVVMERVVMERVVMERTSVSAGRRRYREWHCDGEESGGGSEWAGHVGMEKEREKRMDGMERKLGTSLPLLRSRAAATSWRWAQDFLEVKLN